MLELIDVDGTVGESVPGPDPMKPLPLYFERDSCLLGHLIVLFLLIVMSWALFIVSTLYSQTIFATCSFYEPILWYFLVLIIVPPVISFVILVSLFSCHLQKSGNKYIKHMIYIIHNCCNFVLFLTFVFLLTITLIILVRTTSTIQISGTLQIKGLKAPVTVNRDEKGVVSIDAADESDLMFAQGFVIAQNRLWQFEFQKRVGMGTMSEIVGSDGLEIDRTSRTLGFYRSAQNDLLNVDSVVRMALERYCEGVNAYIATNPSLPFEFWIFGISPQKYQPVDILVWGKMLSFDLSENYERELVRYSLYQKFSLEKVLEFMPIPPSWSTTILSASQLNMNVSMADAEAIERGHYDNSGAYKPTSAEVNFTRKRMFGRTMGASNNWVISGSKSSTGKPILANDPHLMLTSPSIWSMVHLKSPTLDLTGVALTGVPGIMIGKNAYISWGITNIGADVQDFYVMKETNNGLSYTYKNQVLNYEIFEEKIRVSGAADVVLKVKKSINGPIVNDIFGVTGEPIAMKWVTLQDNDTTSSSFLRLNHAKNWDEFKSAISTIVAPSCNIIFADLNGNIGYSASGSIPIRKVGHSGIFPVIGTGEYEYEGYIPFEKLPFVLNPQEGFISSANNRVTPFGFEYLIGHDWEPPFRDMRIKEYLGKPVLDIDDMRSLQMDTKSTFWQYIRFIFDHIIVKNEEWRIRMLQWDGVEKLASQEAFIWERLIISLKKITIPVYQREIRDIVFIFNILNSTTLCDQYKCLDFVAKAFDEIIDESQGFPPNWGEVHISKFDHLIFKDTIFDCITCRNTPNYSGYEVIQNS